MLPMQQYNSLLQGGPHRNLWRAAGGWCRIFLRLQQFGVATASNSFRNDCWYTGFADHTPRTRRGCDPWREEDHYANWEKGGGGRGDQHRIVGRDLSFPLILDEEFYDEMWRVYRIMKDTKEAPIVWRYIVWHSI